MRSLDPIKHGFSIFPKWLAVQNGQKVGILDLVCYQFSRAVFSVLQGCDEMKQFVNKFLPIIFHVTVKCYFQGSYCTFSKCSLSLTQCTLNRYSFNISKISNSPAIYVPLSTQNLFSRLFFVIILKNARIVSLEYFNDNTFASMVLSNRS